MPRFLSLLLLALLLLAGCGGAAEPTPAPTQVGAAPTPTSSTTRIPPSEWTPVPSPTRPPSPTPRPTGTSAPTIGPSAVPEGGEPTEEPTPEGTTPEEPTPEGPTPEGPTPEGPTPEGATPEGPTPEGTTPEEPTSEPPPAGAADPLIILLHSDAQTLQLWNVRTRGGGDQRLARCQGECALLGVAIKPDRSAIAYSIDQSGRTELRLRAIRGTSEQVLSRERVDISAGAFSPDGQQLVLVQNNGTARNLAVLNLDTGDITAISPPFEQVDPPHWLDNGHVIFSASNQSAGLPTTMIADSDGTGGVLELGQGQLVALAPDRSQALLITGPEALTRNERRRHEIVDLLANALGSRTEVLLLEGPKLWSQDSNAILSESESGLDIINAQTGKITPLQLVDPNLRIGSWSWWGSSSELLAISEEAERSSNLYSVDPTNGRARRLSALRFNNPILIEALP